VLLSARVLISRNGDSDVMIRCFLTRCRTIWRLVVLVHWKTILGRGICL